MKARTVLSVAAACFLIVFGLLSGSCSNTESYDLTVDVAGEGEVTKNPDNSDYRSGNNVTLTAVADTGWQFTGWTGDITDNTNPVSVAMDSEKGVTANFVRVYALTTKTVGNGKVSRTPDQNRYQSGSAVTLTAVPDAGWKFSGWTGDVTGSANPATVQMTSGKNATANFVKVYAVDVRLVGSGKVTRSPDQTEFESGTVVSLTAVADPGWQFASWSGDITGSTNPVSTTVTSGKSVTATFIQMHTLTIDTVGNGRVTRTPDYTGYANGTSVTLTAIPETDWEFAGWTGDIASDNRSTITVKMDSPKNITATFSLPLEASFFGVADGVGVPGAAPYTSEGGLHPVVIVSSMGDFHDWDDEIAANWRPDTVADTQLVVCVGEQQSRAIQVCTYDGPNITRYQYYLDVELREAKTGRIVATKRLYGDPPRACHQTEDYWLTELWGDEVTFDQVLAWLQPYVVD